MFDLPCHAVLLSWSTSRLPARVCHRRMAGHLLVPLPSSYTRVVVVVVVVRLMTSPQATVSPHHHQQQQDATADDNDATTMMERCHDHGNRAMPVDHDHGVMPAIARRRWPSHLGRRDDDDDDGATPVDHSNAYPSTMTTG
ncbi:hypothetical protein EDB89DRAFT_1906815 [Lactarius sanguifluus]|nr:hypothetical protein EDB89DRAFT_1906815 [Lactarius sanguifluus]